MECRTQFVSNPIALSGEDCASLKSRKHMNRITGLNNMFRMKLPKCHNVCCMYNMHNKCYCWDVNPNTCPSLERYNKLIKKVSKK